MLNFIIATFILATGITLIEFGLGISPDSFHKGITLIGFILTVNAIILLKKK